MPKSPRSKKPSRWKALPAGADDEQARALLDRYGCPVPFHEVRTRFLGNIASPVSSSPIETVKALWDGELPEVESIDALNELLGALVMGLWNRLIIHQERKAPFRLARMKVPATREGTARLAQVRREELDGFIEGLYGEHERIDLPESASEALNRLAEIRAMLEGVRQLLIDETMPASPDALVGLMRNLRELTKIAEREMHAVVLSCTRARRQMLADMPPSSPLH